MKTKAKLSRVPWPMLVESNHMADRSNGILLDTSVVVAHLRGSIDVLTLTAPEEPLFLPLVALGELYKGALTTTRPEHGRRLVDDFLLIAALLYPDSATAETYAQASLKLNRKGRPIPENDIWIAAVALECNMPLATRDAHFREVDGLDLIYW
jgi:tRNA(fMet)-specific endonuclease VapC